MNAGAVHHLSSESLARLIEEVEPRALLVSPRILRRVIKLHCRIGGPGLRVPHRKSYILPRADLLEIASPSELGLPAEKTLPERVLLLASPASAILSHTPAGVILLRYWRLLFHSHVHLAFHRLRESGRLDEASLRARIARLGAVEFEEASAVLKQENYLLTPPADARCGSFWTGGPAAVYEEFAAVYLELLHFDPRRRRQFFPAIVDHDAVEAVLSEDVDSQELFRQTRLHGADDPEQAHAAPPAEVEEQQPADEPPTEPPGRLLARADLAAQRGNQVRAAILRQRAVPLAPPSQAGPLRAAARRDIQGLVVRLQRALQFPASEQEKWLHSLLALLESAARGVWNREARLLYDLQKVCIDSERELFAVDLVEWVVSGFQRPIKRPLPDQPRVLTVKHLRTASSRLPAARMPDDDRRQLGALLQRSLADAEARLRQTLRPKLTAALDAVQLAPVNKAEQLARDKLVEELLDRVVDSGLLSIGDLRDALARNRLKLPDLGGPVEFFRGDPLIRLNRRLAVALDGIYHRGEIYLRWMQRFSSLFFGNRIGRILTLFLILPILGSVLLLKGVDGLSEEGHKYLGTPELNLFNLYSFVGLALLLLLMLHWPAFRRGTVRALHLLWGGVRGVLYDLPAAFLGLPIVRRLLQSRPFIAFYQYLAKPAVWTAPVTLVLYLRGADPAWLAGISAGVLILVSVLINTRLGLFVEEAAADWLVYTWEMVRDDLLPGLFRWIVWLSRRVRELIEQTIYQVDEWLRFRAGDSRTSFAIKLVLGLVWFVITYIVRFVVNLLIEPQVNPIKHFPVVTVSHKLMLLIAEPIAVAVKSRLGISLGRARTLTFSVLGLIPGIFGFLAWELKENWRLYRANQSPTLDAETVGSHGEQIIHLIRPGFHAGTLPKLYARLRRASGPAERKAEEGLHHVEEAVRRFVDRDLIAGLAASKAWGAAALASGRLHLGANRIRIELCCPERGETPVVLDFANRGRFLTAAVVQAGFSLDLLAEQQEAFANILASFYKEAGVDLIREQVLAFLPPGGEYDVQDDRLTLWLDAKRSRGAVYDLQRPELPPRLLAGGGDGLPGNAKPFLFSMRPISWTAWVEWWERDQAGKGPEPALLPDVRLLPVST